MMVSWHAPDGTTWDLTHAPVAAQVGTEGLGAAPVEITRDPLYGGGSRIRHTHVAEQIVTLPLSVTADPGLAFLERWRALTLAFTQTRRLGAGRLRVTADDGSWREISGHYLTGFEAGFGDGPALGQQFAEALQLLAADPFWYGPGTSVLNFQYGEPRSFLVPFFTVDPAQLLGEQVVTVAGDTETWPVWRANGPFTTFTVAKGEASFTFEAPLDAGEWVTIDTDPRSFSVVDGTGANRVGGLSWPNVSTFPFDPGEQTVSVTLTGAAVGSSVSATYRPRYVSA